MKPIVDARGLACPQPVILTRKAVADADDVTVVVDNDVAVANVSRFARSQGFAATASARPDGTWIELHREGAPVDPATAEPLNACPVPASTPASGPVVVFATSDVLGRGADELGERLMGAFFHTIAEAGPRPDTLVFMNAGVKLVVEGARTVDDLRTLAGQGVDVLACGACLSYCGLTDRVAVGRVSNMYEIAKLLLEAGKVVKL